MKKGTIENLRYLVSDHELIVVTHFSISCKRCVELMPKFEKIALEKCFQNIFFLEIDALENPIIKREIDEKHMPLLSILKKGILVNNIGVNNEIYFREILSELVGSPKILNS